MAANVVVEVGPARSGKTYRLLDRYGSALRKTGLAAGRLLWLAPTARAAAAIRERLLDGGVEACLGPGVTTFDGLTLEILGESQERFWPVDDSAMRSLVRRVLRRARDAGRLDRFAPTALSAGFVDAVVEHFRELKRREIEPHQFAASPSPRARVEEHAALARLYADYQQMLADHALADRDGRHWIARTRLASGCCPSLANLELVVVDGFTDFTPTQHDVLHSLADRSAELLISLPAENADREPARGDLYAKTIQTLEELGRHHPAMQTRPNPARTSNWSALDYIAMNLFGNPRTNPSPGPDVGESLDRLEIVAAAGQQDEIVQIARRIKRRLLDKHACTKPDDIVVVFRSLHAAAPRVREVFTEFGIPFALDSTERLLQAPVIQSLLNLLRLAAEDWPFRRVVAVITNHRLTAIDPAARSAAEWLVRDLQIAAGRKDLLQRVAGLAEAASVADLSTEQKCRAAAASMAAPALHLLANAFDELLGAATLSEWIDALAQFGSSLGLPPFGTRPAPSTRGAGTVEVADTDADRNAWKILAREFQSLAGLDARLGEPPVKLERDDLLRLIVDIASHVSLPRRGDETGRVRVLGAAAARTARAKHLYLAGMSEQAFPMPESAGRLYPEDAYRMLQLSVRRPGAKSPRSAASAPLTVGRSQDEMLLFYEVITRAEESLTISYPALDDKAQSIPPSPYVTEIERLLDKAGVANRRTPPELTQVLHEKATPLSPAEWRISAVERALAGEPTLLAEFCSASQMKRPAESIDAGLRIVHDRARREEFGPAEGLLRSPAVIEQLLRRYGANHLWSPSQWERYAACPYQFYMRDVLGLAPLGELALETDFRRRGGMLHNVLARFHREWREQPADVQRDQARFTSSLVEVLQAEVSAGSRFGIDAALVELDRRQIAKWVEKHFDHWTAYASSVAGMEEPLVPTHFELRFGPARGGGDLEDPGSLDDAFELNIGGEKVRVTGRIDRIDVGRVNGQTVFSVIDYKTGKTTALKAEQIASGERLQLPIYVAAAQSLLFKNEATPIAAGYWTMDRGFDTKGALSVRQETKKDSGEGASIADLQEQAVAQVRSFVAAIRSGQFPVHSRDEHCTSRCDFSTICRIAHVRSLEKTWPPETEN